MVVVMVGERGMNLRVRSNRSLFILVTGMGKTGHIIARESDREREREARDAHAAQSESR